MRKHGRLIVALAVLAVAAGAWSWRFVTLNERYHALAGDRGAEDVVYEKGDVVGYGDAFSLRVDGFEIVDNRDLDAAPEHLAMLDEDDRTGLLRITVFKNDDSDTVFPLTGFTVHGADFRLQTYWDILFDLNPGVKRDTSGVLMRKGEEHSFVLPFAINRAMLERRWDRVDSMALYLIISEHEDIRIQGGE